MCAAVLHVMYRCICVHMCVKHTFMYVSFLFSVFQFRSFCPSCPHPNYPTLNGLMDKLNDVYHNNSIKAPKLYLLCHPYRYNKTTKIVSVTVSWVWRWKTRRTNSPPHNLLKNWNKKVRSFQSIPVSSSVFFIILVVQSSRFKVQPTRAIRVPHVET